MSETNPFEMKPEFQQYQQPLDSFWQQTEELGNGNAIQEKAMSRGWRWISGWGKEGYVIGNEPDVLLFWGKQNGVYYLIHFNNHTVTKYACPSREIHSQLVTEIAFMHWRHCGEPFVQEYTSVDQLPAELRWG